MLNVSFFIAAFSSISWFIYSLKYLNFQTATTETFFQGLMIALIPVALIWGIFAIIKSHYTERRTAHYIYSLIDLVKKNTDSTNALSASLLNNEKESQDSLTLQYFNLLISDINEILSDIIKRSNSISSAQLEHLWTQTAGGERWILAKTFIEMLNYQSCFYEHLQEKALKDNLLKGSILEFHSRYKTIHTLLQNASNKILFDMIEYGALGKVYDILAPLAEKLAKVNSSSFEKDSSSQPVIKEFKPYASTESSLEFPSFLSQLDDKTPTLSEPTITAENNNMTEIEAGLHAIREEILAEPKNVEPKSDIPPAPIISGFSQTQTALRDIKNAAEKKEAPTPMPEKRKIPIISLEELEKEIEASPENNYDEYAYPFGAWANAKNKK